jgi:hybrid cluster-associated redox disulfide protein
MIVANKITKNTNLAELISEYPEAAEVLLDYGLHCVGCVASHFDTVEAGARIHGYSDEEVEEMVTRLNEVVEFGE